MAAAQEVGSSGVERCDEASDADTDDLLTSADILCSGASDKRRSNLPTSNNDHTPVEASGDDVTPCGAGISTPKPQSARRCLRFDAVEMNSERKLHSNKFSDSSGGNDRSHSSPSTPKSNLNAQGGKKNSGPSPGSNHVVQERNIDPQVYLQMDRYSVTPFSAGDSWAFTKVSDIVELDDPEDALISEQRAASLRSLLSSAKCDLANASKLIERAIAPNSIEIRSSDSIGQSSFSTTLSLEERSFLDRLSTSELRELYEAEFCKRRYCEKKIDILQKQLLNIEQKLSIAMAAVDRHKNVVCTVEQACNDFVQEISSKEKERKRSAAVLKRNNDQMKIALDKVIAFGKAASEKLANSNERIQTLESDQIEKSDTLAMLESENASLKGENRKKQVDIETLSKKLEQCETKKKASFEREEQLTKELLMMEKISKENTELVQRLKNDLVNEKAARRSQLEERERQYRQRITELANDFDSRVEKTRQEIEQRTSSELRKLKEEWDSVLYGLSEKYSRMVCERDEALRQLKEYEDMFAERKRMMCYELQQRLSAKYYELLSEFSAPVSSSYGSNGNPTDPPSDGGKLQSGTVTVVQQGAHKGQCANSMWLTMADEFMDRLRNVYPIEATPRRVGNDGTAKNQSSQVYSKTNNGNRAVPPGDGYATNK